MNTHGFIGLAGIISGELIYRSRFTVCRAEGPSPSASPAALWAAWVEENSSSQPHAVPMRPGGKDEEGNVVLGWAGSKVERHPAAQGGLALSEPSGLNLLGSSAPSAPSGVTPPGSRGT